MQSDVIKSSIINIKKDGSEAISLRPVKMLVFQGTTFCNIACKYCYLSLSSRSSRSSISFETIHKTCTDLCTADLLDSSLTVLWQAGEPLVLSQAFYEKAFRIISTIFEGYHFRFAIQTNGTLLSEKWIDLFRKWDASIGLSWDGPPEFHNLQRVARNGHSTSEKVLKAARLLKDSGFPLNVICVLTKESINEPEKLFDFFEQHKVDELSFNIQENDGFAPASSFNYLDMNLDITFRNFLQRYFFLVMKHRSKQCVRELLRGMRFLFHDKHEDFNYELEPLRILTVGTGGEVSTFSSELHGCSEKNLGSLIFDNVHIDGWIERAKNNRQLAAIYRSIKRGQEMCQVSCSYFPICYGGSPANKLAEHGTFEATDTIACRFYKQAVATCAAELVASALWRDAMSKQSSC
jgi:uncharacterized protein